MRRLPIPPATLGAASTTAADLASTKRGFRARHFHPTAAAPIMTITAAAYPITLRASQLGRAGRKISATGTGGVSAVRQSAAGAFALAASLAGVSNAGVSHLNSAEYDPGGSSILTGCDAPFSAR